jgi:hypothetical protein
MMKRRFPDVVGTGSDVSAFNQALRPGQKGGYAEDKEYGSKLSNAFSLVANRMESAPPAPAAQEENPFGSGPTEAQRISQEPDRKVVVEGEREGMSSDDAALYGAVAGLGAGVVAGNTKQPVPPRLEAAQERLRVAQDKLAEVQSRAGSGASLGDLEKEFRISQTNAALAAQELKAAEAEFKSLNKAPPPSVTPSADDMPGRASGPRVPGASASSNYAKAIAGQEHQLPEKLLAQVEDYTKSNPKGAHSVVQKDLANLERIKRLGAGDYSLSGTGPGQLMVPPDVAASKNAAMDAELSARQSADAAERARLASEAEAKRIGAQSRVEALRKQREQSGLARRDADQAVKQARTAQAQTQRAQSGVNVAQQALDRASEAKPGALSQLGGATAKVAPKVLGVISGAATGMAAMEAIDKFKQGDYSGAVLPTLEATFGVMSMLPPSHPILLALRGLGTAGGAALMGYEGYKAVRGEPKTAE